MSGGSGDMGREYWISLARRGATRLYLLMALVEEPRHGYEIMNRIRELSGGILSPGPGSIYPMLRELEEGACLTIETRDVGGRPRKVCTLTARGHRALDKGLGVWRDLLGGLFPG